MSATRTVKKSTLGIVSDKSNLAHALKCLDFMPNWHKIPSSVQYALIELVGNKGREAFNLCLKRHGVYDTNIQDNLWSSITDEMNSLHINDSNKTNANYNSRRAQNDPIPRRAVNVDDKHKKNLEMVRNVNDSGKVQSVTATSDEINNEDLVGICSQRSNLKSVYGKSNCNKSCQRRMASIPRGKDGIRHGKRSNGKVQEALSFSFRPFANPKSNSIICEKSETYLIDLKPPANEPLMLAIRKNNHGGWYECQNRVWNQHHVREDKEDIFICV